MAANLQVNGLVCVTVNTPLIQVWLVRVHHKTGGHGLALVLVSMWMCPNAIYKISATQGSPVLVNQPKSL